MIAMRSEMVRYLVLPVCAALSAVGILAVAVHGRLGTSGSPQAPWQYPMTSSGAVTIWVGMDKSVMRDGFREVGVASSQQLGGELEVYAVEATPGWTIGAGNWFGCQKFSRMKLVGPGRYEGSVAGRSVSWESQAGPTWRDGRLEVEGADAGARKDGAQEVAMPSKSRNNIALLGTCVE
jgi:hypothetical protein